MSGDPLLPAGGLARTAALALLAAAGVLAGIAASVLVGPLPMFDPARAVLWPMLHGVDLGSGPPLLLPEPSTITTPPTAPRSVAASVTPPPVPLGSRPGIARAPTRAVPPVSFGEGPAASAGPGPTPPSAPSSAPVPRPVAAAAPPPPTSSIAPGASSTASRDDSATVADTPGAPRSSRPAPAGTPLPSAAAGFDEGGGT